MRRFKCSALVARAQATRLAAVLVSLALCAGYGGLSATDAGAAAETPQHVTAVATTDSNDDGTVQVTWDAPTTMTGIVDADVSVDGQHAYLAADYPGGVAMYPVAPGTYTVSVVFDYVGGGKSAAGTAAVTVVHVGAPDAVTDVVGSSNGTDVTVSWTPAQDADNQPTGAPADHFTVALDGSTHVDVPAGETKAQFTGIMPGTYALSVSAVNAAGSSTAATGSLHVTGATVASEPLNVSAQDTANGTIGVTWDPPSSNGGNEIQSYEVELSFPDGDVDADGDPVWFFDSGLGVDGSARHWAFYNVPFDQGDYVVTVTAHNASGDGPAGSTDSQPMLHSTAPGAPQHVSATSPEPNKALVSWDAPSTDGGQPVNEYDISLAGNTRFTSGDGRNVTISGIAAGTYTAQVTAFNSNGFSQTSTAQVTIADYATPPVVKPKAPSAPRNIKVAVARHGVAGIRWTAPAPTNGAKVTGYIVTIGGQEKLATGTKVGFAGLTKGTYTVKVVATNAAGKSLAGTTRVAISKALAATAKLTLKAGLRGSDVKALQAKLKMPAKARTGLFGKTTTTYVKRWQTAHHQPQTGVVNAAMRKALKI